MTSLLQLIKHWQNVANYHENQLAHAKRNIQIYENKWAGSERPLSQDALNNRLLSLALSESNEHKHLWKTAVNDGLFENVQYILQLCCDQLEYDAKKPKATEDSRKIGAYLTALGERGYLKWQLFTLDVITKMKNKSNLWDDEQYINCEDTAGGIVEVIEDTAIEIMLA